MTTGVNRTLKATLAAIAIFSFISACGGGGGGSGDTSSPAPAAASAEGVYGGTLTGSTSPNFQLLVLENDEFWSLYGTQTSTLFLVAGFSQGPGTSSNGIYTSASARGFGSNPASS